MAGDRRRLSQFGAEGPPVIVRGAFNRVSRAAGNVYFEQIRVLKAGAYLRLNITAWNDGIGPRSYFVGFL